MATDLIIRQIYWVRRDNIEIFGGGPWHLADSREMLKAEAAKLDKEHPELRHIVLSSTKDQVFGYDKSKWPTKWPAPDPAN